ncbi:calcium/sodium antiporter [Microbacterium aurum]|uniref:calcium/sodium antiporter n=1 Tax=Microbacterium aurum TaxID=36805 RepID=UPI00248E5582|nr:calcium/sodium antiporter [Microbacterium aurum]MBZ6371362.1 calcium/sodium antiporter [Microbacterium hominis]
MNALDIGSVVLGLVVLIGGGEALVRGASGLATRLGVPSLVIGLVIVSASTSAPELSVTIGAVLDNEPDLAVGNAVGSNIVNVLLILGASALLLPLAVKRRLVRFDIPVMVGISILLLLLGFDGEITQLDGGVLLLAAVGHIVLSFTVSRGEPNGPPAVESPSPPNRKVRPRWQGVLIGAALIALGIALLVLGARLLVSGATNIASSLGVSSLIIGLTVVAIGTSLPELATSLIAVRRGERDIAVGNIVGSNIFNLGFVLGLTALFVPAGIPVAQPAIALDIPLMIAAAVALLPIAFTGFTIRRWEGAVFIALYVAYTVYLVLAATQHQALQGFTIVMLYFTLPLLAVTLIAVTAYEIGVIRGRKHAAPASPPNYDDTDAI